MHAEALQEAAKLDGCYVFRTDLPLAVAGTDFIHARYKDLTLVEQAFRTCKTTHLGYGPCMSGRQRAHGDTSWW